MHGSQKSSITSIQPRGMGSCLSLGLLVQVRVTHACSTAKELSFFPGDSVPVLGIKSFLIVYGEHIMNVSILVTIHVKQRAAMFYELNFKEIFLTLLIKLAYAYPAEYKHGDQFLKYCIQIRKKVQCHLFSFLLAKKKNIRILMIPNERDIW